MGEWIEKYNDAERQLEHYRIQATKISRIVPQKIRELEEQVEVAEKKLNVEKDNNLILKQQMNEKLAAQQEVLERTDAVQQQMRAQITQLREEVSDRNQIIVELQDKIEELKLLRKKDEESVSQKVRLIKDHIHKTIKGLEVENIRLKRQVEEVENEKIRQLNGEIEMLKEINQVQACNRMAIFDEAYKKCCRDFGLGSPKMINSASNQPSSASNHMSPIYQQTSSASSQDPLYTAISPDENIDTPPPPPSHPPPFKQSFQPFSRMQQESPPLPPRRTSSSKYTVEERRRKTPVTCCSKSCCPSGSSHYDYKSEGSPPPLSQREEGDGSVSNDYDEIPCEELQATLTRGTTSPTRDVQMRSLTARDSTVFNGSTPHTVPHTTPHTAPHSTPHTAPHSTPHSTPHTAPIGSSVYSPASVPHNSMFSTPQPTSQQQRDPLSPGYNKRDQGCKREASRSNGLLLASPSKHGKRNWETLIDSLALVGFTDTLPQQRCVKSSIGKLPSYVVTEQVSYTDHPFELPPSSSSDDQMSPLDQPDPETEIERVLEKIKYMGESQVKQVLACPILSYCVKPLTAPLTHLTSPYLTSLALRVNKLLLEYAENPTDLYNTSRSLLTLTSKEMVNEVYTQLVKQTHRQSKEILAYWHILATIIPFTLPNGRVLSYLKAHLERYSVQKTPAGRFAGYCTRVLQRCIAHGRRQVHPCRLEVEATCGKPYLHSKPMSIPIHLPGGDYHVTGFDTVSSVSEVIRDLECQLGLRTCRWSGYTLYMDDPVNPAVKVPINHAAKLCDVIAKWETNIKPSQCQIPQVIGLTYMKFLHLTTANDTITPTEYKLSARQLHANARLGYHGMEVELATCLGAVMAQAEEGNCPTITQKAPLEQQLTEFAEKYIPNNILDRCKEHSSKRRLVKEFGEIWQKFKDVPSPVLYQKYFTTAERWKYHKSTLFRGLYSHPKDGLKVAVCLNITENRLTIINAETLVIMDAIELDKIVHFGGYPFTVTLKINNKSLSIMLVDKHKCYLLTELLAAYCRLTHVVARDETI